MNALLALLCLILQINTLLNKKYANFVGIIINNINTLLDTYVYVSWLVYLMNQLTTRKINSPGVERENRTSRTSRGA